MAAGSKKKQTIDMKRYIAMLEKRNPQEIREGHYVRVLRLPAMTHKQWRRNFPTSFHNSQLKHILHRVFRVNYVSSTYPRFKEDEAMLSCGYPLPLKYLEKINITHTNFAKLRE